MIYIDVIFNMQSGKVYAPQKARALDSKSYTIRAKMPGGELTGKVVTANITRPDGVTIVDAAQVIDEDTFEYLIVDNALIKSGIIEMDFSAIGTNSKLTTPKISFKLESPINQEGAISGKDTAPIILQMIASETERVGGEESRRAAEIIRTNNEKDRNSNEGLRIAAETNRVSAEKTRITKEAERQTEESLRISNELLRITAENERVEAESFRAVEVNEARKDLDNVVHEDLKTRLNADAQKVKTIENKINKKDQLSVSLSPTIKVASVTNAYGGACGFEVEGALVENIFPILATSRVTYSTGPNRFDIAFAENELKLKKNVVYTVKSDKLTYLDIKNQGIVSLTNGEATFTLSENQYIQYVVWHTNDQSETNKENFTKIVMVEGNYLGKNVPYFEGLQPLRGVAVEAVGKNLFDIDYTDVIDAENVILKDNWTAYEAVVYDLKPNTSYTVSGESVSIPNIMYVGATNGYKTLFESSSTGSSEIIIITGDNGKLCFACTHGNVINAYSTISNVMLRETQLTDDTYEPYKSSKVVFEDALAKLPNGIADKIVRENGKTIKYVNTNVGRDGNSFKVDVDSIVLNSEPSNVNHIYIPLSKLKDVISQGFVIGNNIRVNNAIEVSEGAAGSVSSIGKFFTTISQLLVWVVSKTEITTIEQAKSYMLNTEIIYQLATPQTIELTDQLEPLNSYENYTQFNVSDGVVEGEKVGYVEKTDGTWYYFNAVGHPYSGGKDTPFKFKVKTIDDVMHRGMSIKSLVNIYSTYSYGDTRFSIKDSVVKANNIDINQIYVTYTTSETNGQPNAKIIYNADMPSAVSSNANAINAVGEQTDRNTKELDRITGIIELSADLVNEAAENSIRPHRIQIKNRVVRGIGIVDRNTLPDSGVAFNTAEYSPSSTVNFRCATNSATITVLVSIATNGNWTFYFDGGLPTKIHLDQIQFKVGE